MKSFIFFWQTLHYNVYRFNFFVSDKIIGAPFTMFLNIKCIRRAYNKRGVNNPAEIVRQATTRPDIGPVNWKTDGMMILFILIIILSILNFISAIIEQIFWAYWSPIIYIILIGVPSILVNYFTLWKNDQYLDYYKEFDKESKSIKLKWAWISFGFVMTIISILIYSFWIMTESIH